MYYWKQISEHSHTQHFFWIYTSVYEIRVHSQSSAYSILWIGNFKEQLLNNMITGAPGAHSGTCLSQVFQHSQSPLWTLDFC